MTTSLTSWTGTLTLGATSLYLTDDSPYSVTVVVGGAGAGDFRPEYFMRWLSLGSSSSSRSSSPSPVTYQPNDDSRRSRLVDPVAPASGSEAASVHHPATV